MFVYCIMAALLLCVPVIIGVQIKSAIDNHKATKGVTIYRIDKDGNLKEIK